MDSGGILLNGFHDVGLLGDDNGAKDLDSSNTIDDAVVADQVTDDVQRHGALGFLDSYLGASAKEDGDGLAVLELLHEQHLVLRGAEGEFLDQTGEPELLMAELLEAGNDTAGGDNGDEFDFRDSGQLGRWMARVAPGSFT